MSLKGKVFVQIPCLNEQATIGAVVKSIPKKAIAKLGVIVKTLLIDDGSLDQSIKKAQEAGIDFVIKHKKTSGLARTFEEGIEFCLSKGADFIVNTDGDDQYDQSEIVKILKPVIEGKADLVIGDRQIKKIKFMPKSKKIGNLVGSWALRLITGNQIADASSGFRAFNRKVAENINLQGGYTYTHETIIQAYNQGFEVITVPVNFKNRSDGNSRLISQGVITHIIKSSATIIRAILLYKAFKYLVILGCVLTGLGVLLGLRFIYFFVLGEGDGHIQSLVLSSVLINLGFMTIVLGFIADLISINRKTLEKIKLKKAQ